MQSEKAARKEGGENVIQPLLVASRNSHKTKEIAAILGSGFAVSDLTEWPELPEPVEDGATFEANARIKALAAAKYFAEPVLADDSGLEVDALGGAPGVISARYAGPRASDAANRAKLLRALEEVGARGRLRTARFRCVLVLVRGHDILATTQGTVEGVIGTAERGAEGFGYDSLFIPDGRCCSFAELPAEEKNRMSHRGRALAAMREALQKLANAKAL